jgi:hypothetical protein
MKNPELVAKQTKLWAGHKFHPFLSDIQILLSGSDFIFDGFFTTAEKCSYAYWRKEAFCGYNYAIRISPENSKFLTNKANIWIDCIFFLESGIQGEVNKILNFTREMWSRNVPVASFYLNWAFKNWGARQDAWMQLQDINIENSMIRARFLADSIKSHGFRFFEHVNTPEKLAASILASATESTTDKPFVGSVEPEIYAITALLFAGLNDLCISPLEQYETKIEDFRIRSISDFREYETDLARIKLLRSWVKSTFDRGIGRILSKERY